MDVYYQDDWVTLYHGDARDWTKPVDVLVSDPPYGVDFDGKVTKHTVNVGGYTVDDDPTIGPSVVSALLPIVKRGAVFPGIRGLFRYPEPWDVGCVYCPSGAGRGRWGWTMFNPILFYGKRPTNESYPSSMTSFATADYLANGHPCPKPLAWLTWLVGLASLPGETVIDPFAGSGTTLFAAKSLGRKAIGIEIYEGYCEIAARRCSQDVLGLVV